jgi:hypothetical protein
LLAPTASGDGAGERFCAPLPPSSHFSGACPEDLTNFRKFVHFYTFLWGDPLLSINPQIEDTRKSRWSWVGTSKIISQPILDFILSSVWSGESWTDLERLGEKW